MKSRKKTFGTIFGGEPPAGGVLILRLVSLLAIVILVIVMLVDARFALAQEPSPRETFASPEEASRALFEAAKQQNNDALTRILGGGKELVSLEDQGQDQQEREEFVTKYQEMHRLVEEPDGATVLYIGAENWPFPVPLVSRRGAWRFDPKLGMREVLFRRIGQNEITAIETCHALAQSAQEYMSNVEGEAGSNPIAMFLASQSYDGSVNQASAPVPYNGYYFRALNAPAGSVPMVPADIGAAAPPKPRIIAVAYPVEYRKTGVMTFLLSSDDVVYQRDLGPDTGKIASTKTEFKAGKNWKPAE